MLQERNVFVEIEAIHFDHRDLSIQNILGNYCYTSQLLIARDPGGTLLGFDRLTFSPHFDMWQVEDFLATTGGAGVGSALQIAAMIFLQSAASQAPWRGREIFVKTEDINARELAHWQSKNPQFEAEIATERARWLALYGPDGSLGNTYDSVGQLGRVVRQRAQGISALTTHITVAKDYIERADRRLLAPRILAIQNADTEEVATQVRLQAFYKRLGEGK